ncbi:ssDNA-binding protein [Candidatus Poriferisocius sp.]|uniref:ssDNA-binding protein n=1 Tax=Candidatus Poriferisocius sp. TaxID=3101276 RepID=UPI003B52C7C7
MKAKHFITTPEGELHFPNLFEPEEFMNKRHYSARIVFHVPKGDKSLHPIVNCIRDAAKDQWGADTPASLKAKLPLKWDDEREQYFITARRTAKIGPPTIFDAQNKPITQDDEHVMYPGCRVRMYLRAHAYDYPGSQGVALLLESVQRLGDGEPIGVATVDPDKMFGPAEQNDGSHTPPDDDPFPF